LAVRKDFIIISPGNTWWPLKADC